VDVAGVKVFMRLRVIAQSLNRWYPLRYRQQNGRARLQPELWNAPIKNIDRDGIVKIKKDVKQREEPLPNAVTQSQTLDPESTT
jgi:hypothetical protein